MTITAFGTVYWRRWASCLHAGVLSFHVPNWSNFTPLCQLPPKSKLHHHPLQGAPGASEGPSQAMLDHSSLSSLDGHVCWNFSVWWHLQQQQLGLKAAAMHGLQPGPTWLGKKANDQSPALMTRWWWVGSTETGLSEYIHFPFKEVKVDVKVKPDFKCGELALLMRTFPYFRIS